MKEGIDMMTAEETEQNPGLLKGGQTFGAPAPKTSIGQFAPDPEYIKKRRGIGIAIITRGTVPLKWSMKLNDVSKQFPGGLYWKFLVVERLSWAAARSECVRKARSNNFQWIFFLDDDVFIPDDAIDLLLKSKKDVISGIYWTKAEHTAPVIFKDIGEGPMYDFEPNKIVPIGGSGLGCCLINMDVFDKFDEAGVPYFVENYTFIDKDGQRMKSPIGEDHYFFMKAKEFGYQPFAHTGVLCDHYDVKADKFYPGEDVVREISKQVLIKQGRVEAIAEREKSMADPAKKTIVIYNNAVPFAGDEIERRGVGGSEGDIIHLAKEFYNTGKFNVHVYCQCLREGRYDGVWYRDVNRMDAELKSMEVDLFISSRNVLPFKELNLKTTYKIKKTCFWAHDLAEDVLWNDFDEEAAKKIDSFVFLSRFHQQDVINKFGFIPKEKCIIIPNGVNPNRYLKSPAKIKGKVVYSSTPYRGLEVLLRIWPEIRRQVPWAELSIFSSIKVYGEHFDDSPWEDLYATAKRLEGVHYHGTVKQDRLAQEQMSSELCLYPNMFPETCCLVGDTKIAIPGGIKLLKDIEIGDTVYGYSSAKNRLSFGKVLNKQLTRKQAPVFEVKYKWGKVKVGNIIGTADHRVLMKNGDYKRIDELSENDSVMPFNRQKDHRYVSINLNNGSRMYEHDFIAKELLNLDIEKGKKIIHHKDGNGYNNLIANLEYLSASVHARNHIINLSEDEQNQRNEKISNSLKEMLTRPEKIKVWSDAQKLRWQNMSYDERYEFLEKRKRASTPEVINKRVQGFLKENKKRMIKLDRGLLEKKYISEKKSMNQISKELGVSDGVIFKNLREYGIDIRGRREAQLALQNHKISEIKFYGYEDVYDLEVDDVHSFVANEIIVHNCVTAMECQMAGTPIITTHSGALPEIVPANCGVLIHGNPLSEEYQDAFIKAAVSMLKEDAPREYMRQECLKHDYDWKLRAAAWINVYFPAANISLPSDKLKADWQRDDRFRKDLDKDEFHYNEVKFNYLKQFASNEFKILDVDCGLGEFPRFLRKAFKGAEIWGTEQSMFALDHCRQSDKTILFANHPIDSPDFEQKYFDVIYSLEPRTTDELQKLFKLIKPTGTIVLVIPSREKAGMIALTDAFDVMLSFHGDLDAESIVSIRPKQL